MRNRVPFMLTLGLDLAVALLNAQNIVPTPGFENEAARASSAPTVQLSEKAPPTALEEYANLPLSFERRGGEEFVARGQGYGVDIRGVRVAIAVPDSGTIGMDFVHARRIAAVPEKELPGKVNYVLGNDPRQWRLGLSTYAQVTYHDLYPSIDVVYYGNQKQLEFDLVLKPGADVKSVRLRFSGSGKPHTDPSGNLMLGKLLLRVPTVIQGDNNIPARYKMLANDEVAFEVGTYDRRQPLIIDPTLVYSTRLGGGNNSNQGNAVALDAAGNTYIAGYTYAADFPVVSSAFAGYTANEDGFISKLNSTGTALIYSTYLGGSSQDYLSGISVDSTGAAWVVGVTSSSDFPLLSPYQNTYGGVQDAVVAKLSPGGSLAYSTFLGGPYQDIGYSVAVDPVGNAYVTGFANTGFPTTAGVYQPVIQGGGAAFVTKFNPSGSLIWSTFVGGTSYDYADGIAVDEFGNSYITGVAYSTSFPRAPPGGAQPSNRGNGDAFVAKLNFNGTGLLYFTFLGGSGYDQANAIGVDPISGIAVVAGQTTSADLSTSPGAVQSTNAGGYDGFVAKLNAAGSAFLYTTYLGGNRNDFINALAVDPNGNAYVAGYTHSNTFPTQTSIQSGIQGNFTSLFRTSNTGASWTPFDTNLPGSVSAISPDPVNAGTIVVSTENGIYRTTNNGGTWTQQFTGNLNLSRSPANAATIYGLSGSAIYQSTDNGVTWLFKGSSQCCAADIVADPVNAGTAYVFNSFNTSVPGVQKTVNNGANWSPATTGLPANPIVLAMAAGSDGSLYAGLSNSGLSPGGLYKSTNQGATWAAANTGLPASNLSIPALFVATTNPSVVYATDYFSLYESTNAGATWTTVGVLPGGTSALAISRTNSTTLYYAAYNSAAQLWVSTNSGGTWGPSTGVGVASVNRIVTDPLNGAGAYAVASVSIVPIVAKIDAAGQNLLYSTYVGDYGDAFGIATNGTGDAFVTGSTWEFPTTPAALQRNRNYNQNNLDGFVARISDATAACSYSVDPPQSLELWFTHLIQYVVTAPSGCSWTASSNQAWVTIASGASGSGSGIVYVLVAANNTAATTMTATLSIADQSVTLTQLPGGCGYNSFSPDTFVVPGGGGTVQVSLIAGVGCAWTLTNNDPTAITVVSGASGTGNGTVTMTVAPNLGPNTRTFVVGSPQGGSETITQAGTTVPAVVSTITSSPSGASITVTGSGCIPGTYTTPANLTWTANTNCTIYFTTPQTIGGLLYTFYSATVNGGPATTTNPLTVNSGTSPPTINANFLAPCTYSFTPSSQSFSASGGLGSFTVNTASTCTWSPVPSASWITILPSGSKGTAKVNFAVASTTAAARAGTISAGGQQFNISQSGFSCTYAINPASASVYDPGGTVQTTVSAAAGCPWTATSNASWITVTSGTSGSGAGAVVMQVANNTGGPRSGTATIAGQTYTVTEGAGACGSIDVSTEVHVSEGQFILFSVGFGTSLFTQSVSITNTSSNVIPGPVYLVTSGMPTHLFPTDPSFANSGLAVAPPGTTFTTCFTAAGDYLIPLSAGNLGPRQTVNLGSLTWIGGPAGLGYSTRVLSGTPSR